MRKIGVYSAYGLEPPRYGRDNGSETYSSSNDEQTIKNISAVATGLGETAVVHSMALWRCLV